MDANESNYFVEGKDSRLITNQPKLHTAKPEDFDMEDLSIKGMDYDKPTIDIVYDKGSEDEATEDYLSVLISPPEGVKKAVSVGLSVDRDKFSFPSNKEEIKEAIKDLENGKLEGLKPDYMDFTGPGGSTDRTKANWTTDGSQTPKETAENLNKIWSVLPEVLDTNPSKLTLVKKLPENGEPVSDGAEKDQNQSEISTPGDASPEQSPEQVLALQYEHINSGDYEAAYELFAEESQEIVSLDQYRAFFEDLGYYQLSDYSFPSVDVQGDSAVVEVNLTSETPNGEGQFQPVQQMILEDGEWRAVMRDDQIETFTETG